MKRECIDNVESLERALTRVRKAQEIFGTYSQEQVDKIFIAAAIAANQARIPLAEMAVEETGMGIVEDKVIKNHYAAEYIYNAYRYTKTCGVIEEDKAYGIKKLAEPIGVIAAVIPTTNPTSTVIFKTLIALKTRNGIIISPHPRAKNSSIQAAKIILEAAVKAGAPEGIIDWIDAPSLDLTNMVMKEADTILATGGPGMVKAAYSSGKPAIGVGAGNVPAIIDDSADILLAVNRAYNKSDYIPCIAWGRNARFCQNLEVGSEVKIVGRVQSRTYEKKFEDGTTETRVAYEVSVASLEVIEKKEDEMVEESSEVV